jgi:hypothetical protein
MANWLERTTTYAVDLKGEQIFSEAQAVFLKPGASTERITVGV